MDRKMYEPTKNQERKWAKFTEHTLPSDEHFQERGRKEHRPWGIIKRDYVLSNMTQTCEYQIGLWQGRVDAARGLEYSEDRNENTYNLGYYRGYNGYESNRRGWDSATCARFDEKYVSKR